MTYTYKPQSHAEFWRLINDNSSSGNIHYYGNEDILFKSHGSLPYQEGDMVEIHNSVRVGKKHFAMATDYYKIVKYDDMFFILKYVGSDFLGYDEEGIK